MALILGFFDRFKLAMFMLLSGVLTHPMTTSPCLRARGSYFAGVAPSTTSWKCRHLWRATANLSTAKLLILDRYVYKLSYSTQLTGKELHLSVYL